MGGQHSLLLSILVAMILINNKKSFKQELRHSLLVNTDLSCRGSEADVQHHPQQKTPEKLRAAASSAAKRSGLNHLKFGNFYHTNLITSLSGERRGVLRQNLPPTLVQKTL